MRGERPGESCYCLGDWTSPSSPHKEIDVYVQRYALLVELARNDDDDEYSWFVHAL